MEATPHPDPRAELEARINAGEFDAFLAFRGTADGTEQEESARQGLVLSAYAARVACHPATNFAGFVDELWVQIRSLFQIGEFDTRGVERRA